MIVVMKFAREHFGDKGIALIFLIVLIIIFVSAVAIALKGLFDAKSIGATSDDLSKEVNIIRKICRIYS